MYVHGYAHVSIFNTAKLGSSNGNFGINNSNLLKLTDISQIMKERHSWQHQVKRGFKMINECSLLRWRNVLLHDILCSWISPEKQELSIFTTKVCIVSVVWTYMWGIDSFIIKCENNIPTMQPYTGISRRTIGFGFIIDNNV
mgnify:CR=1 FL=1